MTNTDSTDNTEVRKKFSLNNYPCNPCSNKNYAAYFDLISVVSHGCSILNWLCPLIASTAAAGMLQP